MLAVWIFQTLLPITAIADGTKNYAVVFAGPDSEDETSADKQEAGFAMKAGLVALGLKDKGYDTNFLFSLAGLPGEKGIKPGSRAAEQYEFLRRQKLLHPKGDPKAGEQSGTNANLIAAMEKILKEAKAGAKVEIIILGHGSSCGCSSGSSNFFDSEASSPDDAKPGVCDHRFMTGDDRFPTEKIAQYLLKMEEKGLLPNLVLDSCHSGALLRALTKLKSTCAYMLSTGNSPGVGCGEVDPPEIKDKTSTVEAMFARYYGSIVDKVKDDPYLKAPLGGRKTTDCFLKVYERYKGKDISTMEKAFWTGRSLDESANEPRLSPLHDVPYFSTGHYNRPLLAAERRSFDIKGKDHVEGELAGYLRVKENPGRAVATRAIDETRAIQNIQQMIAFAKLDKDEAVKALRAKLADALTAYNTSVAKQEFYLESEKWNELSEAQKDTEKLADGVIKAERALVDYVRTKYFETDQAVKDNPKIAACRRPL